MVDIEALERELAERLRVLPMVTEPIRALRREYSRLLAKESPRDVVDLALRLFERPGFRHRFVAYELVAHHKGALASLGTKELKKFARDLDSWESVDTFCSYLAGPAWRERQVPESMIHTWARSKDRWLRRSALVCTVPLNNKARGGRGDTERTLDICRMLLHDRDDMVEKALSWALRELAKHDPASVRAFVTEQDADLPARVRREVRNKLETGLKNPRKF